jgi:hypothetical protein
MDRLERDGWLMEIADRTARDGRVYCWVSDPARMVRGYANGSDRRSVIATAVLYAADSPFAGA